MLESTSISDERTTTYATDADLWNVMTNELNSLYLLSFLLTADHDKARQCFFSGMGQYEEKIGVFMSWTRGQARRTILQRAIGMIMPAPERDDCSFTLLKGSTPPREMNLFDAILGLDTFERFVYVMSVLEKQSDDDCSTLLRCSRRDVIITRALALERLANTHDTCDQPTETVGARRTMFANGCA
jgi:hypothetical protein